MPFVLSAYLLFLTATLLLFYSVRNENKLNVLLLASAVFIATVSLYALFFVFLFAIVNYFLAIRLENEIARDPEKKVLFRAIILLDVGILFCFKYVFIRPEYTPLHLSLVMPIGLSYYTFQVLGYIIRINRQTEKAQRDFAGFALYLAFFPKILSGPVERSNHFFPQIASWGGPDREALLSGTRLFMLGLFKKMVIADNLFDPLFSVYNDVHRYNGLSLLSILFFQTVYMYADFSGYSDMAKGTAGMFGLRLADNFNRPFLSKSISEYWKRWHISLSSWCNDFIYNPFIVKYRHLGSKAVIPALFLTFFVVGIWHGANMTFVILGLLQAIAIIYENYTKRTRLKIGARLPRAVTNSISRVIVFFFMSFSMIWFFSASVSDAWYVISHSVSQLQIEPATFTFIKDRPAFLFALLNFAALFIFEMTLEKKNVPMSAFLAKSYRGNWLLFLYCLVALFFTGAKFYPFYYMRF